MTRRASFTSTQPYPPRFFLLLPALDAVLPGAVYPLLPGRRAAAAAAAAAAAKGATHAMTTLTAPSSGGEYTAPKIQRVDQGLTRRYFQLNYSIFEGHLPVLSGTDRLALDMLLKPSLRF